MPVVASWDGTNRHIHLAQGVTSFHPIEDIYREYREQRRTNEAFRKWNPFMEAYGNISKGGGKFTPRYLLLLEGTKIVPYDEAGVIAITGEIITDDQTDPIYYEVLTNPVVVRYEPSDAEIITVSGGGISQTQMDELIEHIWASSP